MQERYLSPALHDQDATARLIAPLTGVEAEIYNDLWNAIIERQLKPGAKIEELVLSEIYGISRTVVRKVLVIMEQEGVVSLPLNRGAYVASPSFRDARELLEATAALLAGVVGELAMHPDRITAEHRRMLSDHAKAQRKAEAEQDAYARLRLQMEYLILLAVIHDNRLMAGSVERTSNRLAVALSLFQDTPAPDSRAEFSETLTRHILEGAHAKALAHLHTYFEAVGRTLRPHSADTAVDLRAILGHRRGASPNA
ncbi:MAG TPA: GntR family transcriptional regulator [Rhizobiaceae bacterium]|nr:GntR family transcriptional regulator [Rhizobiaceae bacterium]